MASVMVDEIRLRAHARPARRTRTVRRFRTPAIGYRQCLRETAPRNLVLPGAVSHLMSDRGSRCAEGT
jgi:hypothetical protein